MNVPITQPRTPEQRRRDTEHRLANDVDCWVASASDDAAYLIPLSFSWDGRTLLLAMARSQRTGANLAKNPTVRIALGATRDVVLIDGDVDILGIDELPPEEGDRFAARCGFDPRSLAGYSWFRVTPRRIQAWREEDELSGRDLMRAGRWLV
ncbi:pyridoxamine 5'-phosphate oxidase family protein [Georgenia deserti]|uniref:Pyridoxamine 5'-phosphate oxidase family protein n=1 Tax=Georgenia deserti TaxID=2093781 RepID=A0ABW4L358_9MICO